MEGWLAAFAARGLAELDEDADQWRVVQAEKGVRLAAPRQRFPLPADEVAQPRCVASPCRQMTPLGFVVALPLPGALEPGVLFARFT